MADPHDGHAQGSGPLEHRRPSGADAGAVLVRTPDHRFHGHHQNSLKTAPRPVRERCCGPGPYLLDYFDAREASHIRPRRHPCGFERRYREGNQLCVQPVWCFRGERCGNGHPHRRGTDETHRKSDRAQGPGPRSSALVARFLEHYSTHVADNTRPYPGVEKVLRALRRYRRR